MNNAELLEQLGQTTATYDLLDELESVAGVRQVEEKQPEMGLLESAIRGVGQGGTFGFGDELNAGIVASRKALTRKLVEKIVGNLPEEAQSTFAHDYQAERDKERARNQKSREDNPLVHTGAEIATGLAMGAAGASALPNIGAQTLRQAAPRLAGIGALEGGAYGAGMSEGETAGEVLKDTAVSAGWGAFAGVGIPMATQGIGRAYQRLVKTQGQKAADMVISDLKKAGYTPEEAAKYLEANPSMIAADLSENLKWRTADVATSPGQGAEDITEFLTQRNTSQLDDRIEPFFKRALGGNADEGFEKTLKRAQDTLSAQAKPLYDEAYEVPIRLTDEMNAVLNSPAGREALERATTKAANDNVAFGPGSNVRLLHYVGRSFSDMADSVGKHTDEGAQYISMKAKILDEVKNQNPAFRQAQSIYSDGKSVQDAFEEGVKALNGNTMVKVDRIKDMSEAEKVAMRSGLFQGLLQKLGAKPDTADVTRMFKQPNIRKVLKAAFDDEAQFEAFEELIKKEGIMSETAQVALHGSRTKPLTSFGDNATEVAETILTGDPLTAAMRYGGRKAMEFRGEQFRNELAPLLTSGGNDILDLLVTKQQRTPYQVTQTLQKLGGQ